MTKFTEGRHPGEFLLSEAEFNRSRDNATIGASQTVTPGTLLARIAVVAGVVAEASAGAGNTASAGTIAMGTPPVTSKVKDGRYKGIASAATKVDWEDPTGKAIGTSTHGAEFSKGGVKFTITAGGSANVAGDEFYIDVAVNAEDTQFVAYDPAGTDGSDVPGAIALYGAVTGEGETADISIISRAAQVKGLCLEWPVGATPEQQADAIQALAERGIIVR